MLNLIINSVISVMVLIRVLIRNVSLDGLRNSITKSLSYLALLTSLSLQIVHAAPPIMDDFAYSANLSDAKTSLRQLELPLDVYSKMYRRDYGDLRIFSADGQVVPHQFSRTETTDSTNLINLDFYPLDKELASDSSNISIEINQNTGKQQLKINQSLNNEQDKKVEYQYIIENSYSPKSPIPNDSSSLCKLKLTWEQNKPSLILSLKLESSRDLQQWRSLSNELNVSRLSYAQSELVRDEIEFNCTNDPFLRLTWLNQNITPDTGVHLSGIQGFYTHQNAQKSEWKSFGKPQYDGEGNWLFESDVVAPLMKMEFNPPQNGLLFKGGLYSRNNKEQQWRYRKKIIQYRLNLGDGDLQSNSFSLEGVSDRYWKFEPSTETKFTEAQLPEIKVTWRSNKVLFIAQGSPPFQLAFGNPQVLPAESSDLNDLIQSLQDSGTIVNTVTFSEIIDKEKSFIVEEKTNWKKIAFWFVLLLGTLLMAFMAYRLFQQMGEDEKNV